MLVARSEILIAAPAEEIWALISDLERGPEWSAVTLECQITSEARSGLGCTYRTATKFAASKITTEHEIAEWVPPRRMVSKVIKGAQSTFTQTCEAQGEGTVLTMTNEFVAPGALPEFLTERLTRQVTNILAQELARIKEVVEGSPQCSKYPLPGPEQ